MGALAVGNFSLMDNVLMWKNKQVCKYSDFNTIVNSLNKKSLDNRVMKVDKDRGKYILKTMDKGIVFLDINESLSVLEKLAIIEKEREAKLSFIERISKVSNDSDFDNLFNNKMIMEDYYYLSIAKSNKLNANVSMDCIKNLNKKDIYAYMIIETCVLVNLGILDKDKVNQCFSKINTFDVFTIIKNILELHGNKFKQKLKSKEELTKAYNFYIGGSFMFPLYKTVDSELKLKSSKSLYDFSAILESDVNLKYLKVLKLLDVSKSVKLVVDCYNVLLDELNHPEFKLEKPKGLKYSNMFKSYMLTMKEVLIGIKDNKVKDIEILALSLQDKIK